MDDLSLEVVEADMSKSVEILTDVSQRDASFVTPTKTEFVEPRANTTTPRRSPRVPKPIKLPDFESPKSQNSPKTPKSKVTSTPRAGTESDVDIPDSPILDASSNDSFVAPSSSIFKALQASPKKTPTKAGCGTPSKRTPHKLSDSLNKSGPSPYKSHRPKYLPKNIKLYKKKGLERSEFLKKVEKYEAQLMKIPSLISSPKRVNPIAANDEDVIGTKPHVAVIFHPEKFFVNYDEQSFDSKFDLSVAELVRTLSENPKLVDKNNLRIISFFLTVTSDRIAFDAAFLFVKENLNRVNYILDWDDLKSILINLGLTIEHHVFDSAGYSAFDFRKSPKIWNFEFLFWILEHSFHCWTKKRLIRLVKFLSDCLFDPILQMCQHKVILLLRRVAKYILQNGVSEEELVAALNHSHYSNIANRTIVQFLSSDPLLKPLTTSFAYIAICTILHHYGDNCQKTFGHVADALADINRVRQKTIINDVYQLIIICECLVSMSARPFEPETKTFVGKLADFADQMSVAYSYYENLYFTDTVARLRTLSTINNF